MNATRQQHAAPRFPTPVDTVLRTAGWQPGRRNIEQAEIWADALRAHITPGGHPHAILPSAVEVWAEFGGLPLTPEGPGHDVAPTALLIDPLLVRHAARTLGDLGRALDTRVCPLGAETHGEALLVTDTAGRVYAIDPTGDWYLGSDFDAALTTLLLGTRPLRLTPAP